jgi:hypothetical protein
MVRVSLMTRGFVILDRWCHEEESVNGSQMDIKRKNMWYSNLEETFISRHILHQRWYTWVETRSIEKYFGYCLGHFSTSASTSSSSAKSLPRFSHQLWTALRDKHFPPQTGNISLWISFTLSHFAHKNALTERCSSVVHSSSTVAILTIKISLWTCACASVT